MAQDIGFDISASGLTVDILDANLATGALSPVSTAANSNDLGAPAPLELAFELKLDCQASCTLYAYLKAYWSVDGTDFTLDDPDNGEVVAVVLCKASTVVIKCGSFPVRAQYVKFGIENQSGGTINDSANTALVLYKVFGDQA